jgi:hypothetical protein
MGKPEIRKDEFYNIPISNGEPLMVNAKYDRIDTYSALGVYMLKCMDDERGMITAFITHETAQAIIDFASLPLVEREFLYETEYEAFITTQADSIDDSWLD